MITVRVNHKDETVTYSKLVVYKGRLFSFRITKYLYYAKPYHLNHKLPLPIELREKGKILFEELFFWPEEFYISEKRNHFVHDSFVDSGFNKQTKKPYEVNWEEIFVKLDEKNNSALLISNDKNFKHQNTMYMAIPPNTPGVTRYDYVTDDGMMHYNAKQGEYQGIEIFYNGKQKILSW